VRTTVVVIGAGHAGLAMSHHLTDRSIDHVVLERGEVASSWRSERWASMRLLTPNWQTTLPGMGYLGEDPDGYMTAADVASVIGGYATRIAAPVRTSTTVERVHAVGAGYAVTTDRGRWRCDAVVIASGPCNVASVPACAAALPPTIAVHTPMTYRTPDQLGDGGVLVVGASATGVQLAQEIHRSGRPVTLAVGEHVRLPRTYRGRDVFWWMDAAGTLDQRWDRSTSRRSLGMASRSPVGSDASSTAWRSSRARSRTRVRWRT
jgi:putative flavoprotein involved in K+ transport